MMNQRTQVMGTTLSVNQDQDGWTNRVRYNPYETDTFIQIHSLMHQIILLLMHASMYICLVLDQYLLAKNCTLDMLKVYIIKN